MTYGNESLKIREPFVKSGASGIFQLIWFNKRAILKITKKRVLIPSQNFLINAPQVGHQSRCCITKRIFLGSLAFYKPSFHLYLLYMGIYFKRIIANSECHTYPVNTLVFRPINIILRSTVFPVRLSQGSLSNSLV